MVYRVVQWATGAMGRTALRAVLDHPDLELVGLYVYNQGGWLIAHRQLLFEWSSAHPLDESWAALGVDSASLKRGGKLADDPLYAALAELKGGTYADG